MSTRVQQPPSGLPGVDSVRARIVKTTSACLRTRNQPLKSVKSAPVVSTRDSRMLPLGEKIKNPTSETPTKRPENTKSTPSSKQGPSGSSVKRNVTAVVNKTCSSPVTGKGVTKPRSTIKRRKLPKHSGVPVSFSKKKLTLLQDDYDK